MYEVLDKDTIKTEILPHLSVENVVVTQKATCWKVFQRCSSSCKLPIECRLIPRFHDTVSVGREQHALQPPPLAVVSVRGSRAVDHARTYSTIILSIFSNKFNTITALSINQSPTLPQIIDSRGGLF